MKRAVTIGAAALLLVLVVVLMRDRKRTKTDAPPPTAEISNHKAQITNSETPSLQNSITPPPPANDSERTAARADIRKLDEQIFGLLLQLKDPYRPPLGDNTDITRALTGHNRRGVAAISTNDPSIVNDQLVDRWGTPYWFHPRAADAIDIVSAGPDRELFTDDDITSDHFQPLEKPAAKVPTPGNPPRRKIQ